MRILALLPILLAYGCITVPAPAYQARIDTTSSLLSSPTVAMNVGHFSPDGSVNNTRLSLRGNGMTGGEQGTFTGYLQRALEIELRTAGRYDANSTTVIGGRLLRNEVNAAGVDSGSAHLSAQFKVTQGGQTLYDRELIADKSWASHFMGPIAVQAAMEGYVATMQDLIGKLFADPDFKFAVQK